MERGEAYYGSVKFSHFLPTVSALRYLNCCWTAGWHKCNRNYHLKYEKGIAEVFVVYTVKGAGWIEAGEKGTGQKHWDLTEGTLCIIPPNTFMEYATAARTDSDYWEFYWLNLDGAYVRHLAGMLWEDGQTVHKCQNADFFRQTFQWLLETSLPEKSRETEHSAKLQELFLQLVAEQVFQQREDAEDSGKVAEHMLEFIQKNYGKKITLEEFSGRFFLSKNQLIRIFRKRTGYAPYEYIKQYRLRKACELLQGTTLHVGEVGGRVGYSNNSHFASQFRECYGMTPTEYRGMFAPRGESSSPRSETQTEFPDSKTDVKKAGLKRGKERKSEEMGI